jgi:hypothetical protein
VSPVVKPRTPWEAQRYLHQHGGDSPYSERAAWILLRFALWQQDPTRRDLDWSETAWRRHQQQGVAA